MAGRTQPIVYKPTNVTKYADAYANRLDAAAAEAKKQQAERDKRREEMSDKLDVAVAKTFTDPKVQDAWERIVGEKLPIAQNDPNKIVKIIGELNGYATELGKINTNYINKSNGLNAKTHWGVPEAMGSSSSKLPEGFNVYDFNALAMLSDSTFNTIVERRGLSEPIAKATEKALKDLYNGPRRDEFFVKDELIRNSSGGVESESFARYILPEVEVQREVANIIGASLEDADYIEAAFRAQNNPDFSLDTLISQEELGLSPLSGRNQPTGGQGGGTTIDFKYLGDNTWRNAKFSFVRGETKKGRTPKFQEDIDTDFISVEKRNPTSDVPIQEYFYKGQNIKGRVKGIEKVGNTTYAIVPTTIDVPKVINGKEYPNSKVKKRVDARVELDPTYNLSIFTNAYKISPSQLESMFSNERGETQSGNFGYNNPKNKRFPQGPPTPPSMGQ